MELGGQLQWNFQAIIQSSCNSDTFKNEHIAVIATAWATFYDLEYANENILARNLLLKSFGNNHAGDRLHVIKDLIESGVLFCSNPETGWLASKSIALTDDFQKAVEVADKTGSMPPLTVFTSEQDHLTEFLELGRLFRLDERHQNDVSMQQQKMRQFIAKEDRSTCDLPLRIALNHAALTTTERIALVHIAYGEHQNEIVSLKYLQNLMGLSYYMQADIADSFYEPLIAKGLVHILSERLLRLNDPVLVLTKSMRDVLGFKDLDDVTTMHTVLKNTPEFVVVHAEHGLADVIVSQEVKSKLKLIVQRVGADMHTRLLEWGVKIPGYHGGGAGRLVALLHGPPGTGKTMSAYAIAKELGRPVITTDASRFIDAFVGETEKRLRSLFDRYYLLHKRLANPPILVINEADSLLNTRIVADHAVDQMANNVVAILLEEIERFPGIMILTTNYAERIDSAFNRRIDVTVEVSAPDLQTREELWHHYLPTVINISEKIEIARRMSVYPLTGSQIKTIVVESAAQYLTERPSVLKMNAVHYAMVLESKASASTQMKRVVGFV